MAKWSNGKKNRVAYVVFAVLVCAIVFAYFRALYIWSNPQKEGEGAMRVELSLDGEVKKDFAFTATKMLPGETEEYELLVETEESETFSFAFSFSQGEQENVALAKFVTVDIYTEESAVGSVSLEDAIAGKEITAKTWVEANRPIKLTVRYTLSSEADDSVQGATAEFYLTLTAKAE